MIVRRRCVKPTPPVLVDPGSFAVRAAVRDQLVHRAERGPKRAGQGSRASETAPAMPHMAARIVGSLGYRRCRGSARQAGGRGAGASLQCTLRRCRCPSEAGGAAPVDARHRPWARSASSTSAANVRVGVAAAQAQLLVGGVGQRLQGCGLARLRQRLLEIERGPAGPAGSAGRLRARRCSRRRRAPGPSPSAPPRGGAATAP